MSALPFVASNVASFVLGALMWRWIALREARALTGKGDRMSTAEQHPATTHHQGRRQIGLFRVIVISLFAASLVLIGFGIQQRRFQDGVSGYQDCVNTWAGSLVTSVREGRKASKGLSQATSARDRARADWEADVGTIFLTVTALSATPPRAKVEDLKRLLARFPAINATLITAQHRVDVQTRRVRSTQDANPIPALHCKP